MKYCPVCKSIGLKKVELQQGLPAYYCERCEGQWLKANDYQLWLSGDTGRENNELLDNDYLPKYDSKKASFCPDCRKLLIKYNVSNKIPFYVDHCRSCNGVWLDKHEWENLASHNLHTSINKFFTTPWQKKLRDELTKDSFIEHYKKKFGTEEYEKLIEIREWIYNSNQKEYLLNFLIDEVMLEYK